MQECRLTPSSTSSNAPFRLRLGSSCPRMESGCMFLVHATRLPSPLASRNGRSALGVEPGDRSEVDGRRGRVFTERGRSRGLEKNASIELLVGRRPFNLRLRLVVGAPCIGDPGPRPTVIAPPPTHTHTHTHTQTHTHNTDTHLPATPPDGRRRGCSPKLAVGSSFVSTAAVMALWSGHAFRLCSCPCHRWATRPDTDTNPPLDDKRRRWCRLMKQG